MSQQNKYTPASELPMAERKIEDLPGHWLLARLGKRVLRPGGKELTEKLLAAANVKGTRVVELAPGLGKTAALIMAQSPASYHGVDESTEAVALVKNVVQGKGQVHTGSADNTGLEANSADIVLGEAMLTMQGEKGKIAIVAEARRILRDGGRYAIHELCLEPDSLSDTEKTEVRKALARSIKVNARPLTTEEWKELLTAHGFQVESVQHNGMKLLEPGRMIADEGLLGALRIMFNLLRNPSARKRVLGMRKVFKKYRNNLAAIAIVATKTP